jgi:hypothetical protein
MKATRTLMVAALAAAGLGMADMAAAQAKHGGHGYRGGNHHHGGHRHWHGGHRHHWNWGWSIGVPLAIGAAWAWHDPYWYGPRVVYRDVIRDEGYVGHIRPLPGDESIRIEGTARPEADPAPAAPQQQNPAAGAPTTGPLYMNYCESARAYYPKVTSCPEGWKFQTPTR